MKVGELYKRKFSPYTTRHTMVRLQHYGAPEANAFNASQDLHRNECSAEQNTHALAGHAQADSSGSDNSRCRRPGVLRYRRSCGERGDTTVQGCRLVLSRCIELSIYCHYKY